MNRLPLRKTNIVHKPIGNVLRDNFRLVMREHLINYAWELLRKIDGEEKEYDWESEGGTPRLNYQEHNLTPFSVKSFVEYRDRDEIFETLIIVGIGYDVDNIYFIDESGDWVELDEMTIDELCNALNNIDANIHKLS